MKTLIAIFIALSAISANAALTLETKFDVKITMDGKKFSGVRVFATYNQQNSNECKLRIGKSDLFGAFTQPAEVNCAYVDSSNTLILNEAAIRDIAIRSYTYSCAIKVLKSSATCSDFSNTADQGIINRTITEDSILNIAKNALGDITAGIRTIKTNSHTSFDLKYESNRITIDLSPARTKIVID